ncbi:MAG: hypothetical protein HYX53_16125 [Chloroflexi bacterium]|nr:hypothetical protein [Chloroflexota bacterium]
MDLKAELDSTSSASSCLGYMSAVVLLALLVTSYLLGWPYLLINLVLVAFLFTTPLMGAGRNEAVKQLVRMSAVMYCWRRDDPEGYLEFLGIAYGVEKLDRAMQDHAT